MTAAGPTSHRYISQRLKLHYVDWGNEGAPPLILLHGGLDHCRSWDWTAEALREDWHVMAPDLRGHGDSEWSPDGDYTMAAYLYDFAQFIHQRNLAPATIVAHSLGGNIALRYAGLYPDAVKKIVAIEGLGPSPQMLAKHAKKTSADQLRHWIETKRAMSAREHKRYESLDDAYKRMRAENKSLTEGQARHLTRHGATANEDGTWSWKFDNYVRIWGTIDISQADRETLWRAITCPTLLLYGVDSWASNPAEDGRLEHFQNARVEVFDAAGHWLHHDQFEKFISVLRAFL